MRPPRPQARDPHPDPLEHGRAVVAWLQADQYPRRYGLHRGQHLRRAAVAEHVGPGYVHAAEQAGHQRHRRARRGERDDLLVRSEAAAAERLAGAKGTRALTAPESGTGDNTSADAGQAAADPVDAGDEPLGGVVLDDAARRKAARDAAWREQRRRW
jgi:hypothetical protein